MASNRRRNNSNISKREFPGIRFVALQFTKERGYEEITSSCQWFHFNRIRFPVDRATYKGQG
jgi:hypothetical protein